MKPVRLLAAVLLLATAACREPDPRCATLPGGGGYCLQPTSAVAAFDLQQKVESRLRERRDTLIVELEVDAAGLRLVGLTPFGHKLVQLHYDNQTVSATTLADARLSPALLVALLQLALWPADAVRAGLQAPLTLEQDSYQRRILRRGEPVLSIAHSGGSPPWRGIQMTVHAADLELGIETLDAAPAAGKEE